MADDFLIYGKTDTTKLIAALAETSNLFLKVDGNACEFDNRKIKDIVEHSKVLSSRLVQHFNVQGNNLRNYFIISKIREISSLAVNFYHSQNGSFGSFNEFSEKFIQIISEIDFDENEVGIVESSSLNCSIEVKMSILNSINSLSVIYSLFNEDLESSYEQLKELTSRVVRISKTLSDNWSDSITDEEKNLLFSNAINLCTELFIQEIKANVLENSIDKDDLSYEECEQFWLAEKQLNTVIVEMNMGYADHPELTVDWLKCKIHSIIIDEAEKELKMSRVYENEFRQIVRINIIKYLSKKCIDYWIDASQEYMDFCQGMTQEEFNQWAETEGDKPMPLDDFIGKIKSTDLSHVKKIDYSILSFDIIENKVKNKVGFIWGLSDALFKMREVNEKN